MTKFQPKGKSSRPPAQRRREATRGFAKPGFRPERSVRQAPLSSLPGEVRRARTGHFALAAWKLEPLSVNAPEHDAQAATRPASHVCYAILTSRKFSDI
jgi:hypothetical protein